MGSPDPPKSPLKRGTMKSIGLMFPLFKGARGIPVAGGDANALMLPTDLERLCDRS